MGTTKLDTGTKLVYVLSTTRAALEALALERSMGVGVGLTERSARWGTRLAMRLSADLSAPVGGGGAGREPASMASVTGEVDRWRRRVGLAQVGTPLNSISHNKS